MSKPTDPTPIDYGTNLGEPIYRSSYKPKPIRHMAAPEDLTGRQWLVPFLLGWIASLALALGALVLVTVLK